MSVTRRSVVKAAVAGAALAAGSEAFGLDRTPAEAATPPSGSDLSKIKHIVIVMQENRSFDHYFGSLQGVRGFDDKTAIVQPGGESVFNQPNNSGTQYPWHLGNEPAPSGQNAETLAQCSLDLDHSWGTQHEAWNNGNMDGWVAAKGHIQTLGYLTRADIPFHYALADAYTICDEYFCSSLTQTGPNRVYLWSGTIDADGKYGDPAYAHADFSGLKWKTYAESLQDAGVSWFLYQNAKDNYTDNGLAYFQSFSDAAPGTPLHDQGMGSVPTPSGNNADDIAAAIKKDVLAGRLPQVSWVVSNDQYSEHPSSSASAGAYFVHGILDAVYADPAVGDSTLVMLNYDENDGFFDHVPPPIPPAGSDEEFVDGLPVGLGFRVPMIMISPWNRGGWVNSQVADHTSVIRFLEQWTAAIGKPANCDLISPWRRSICGDLTSTFDFANPIFGLPDLPDTSSYVNDQTCSGTPNPTPSTNALPTQETGTRKARALPYQPNAWIDSFPINNTQLYASITMSNDGPQATATTPYTVYANNYRTGGPWNFTVDPYTATGGNGTLKNKITIGHDYGDGKYDLSVHGPNRFLRRFTGDRSKAAKDIIVRSYYDNSSTMHELAIFFEMTNNGTTDLDLTITPNQYRNPAPWHYTVPAGGSTTDFFNNVAYSHGWYDFTVTCAQDTTWTQRFAGHLETGEPSITG